MEFENKKEDTHKPVSGVFTAPSSGYYYISSRLIKYIPTGEFETIPNPDKKWYEFWKPKMITREIFKQIEVYDGYETKFLKNGESIRVKNVDSIYKL